MSPGSFARILAGDVWKRRSLSLAFKRTKTFILVKRQILKDPFDTFDWLMEASEKYNLVSSFNFMAAKPSAFNLGYSLRNPSIQSLMKRIDQRGHSIGFHPSYESSENEEVWLSEYRSLSAASPQKIKGGRQHYLRFKTPITWRFWSQVGATYEGSFSYQDIAGFRGGMIRAFQAYDVEMQKPLLLQIQPLMLMDTTLFGYMDLEEGLALEFAQKIIRVCRKYDGDFTILWHNSDSIGSAKRRI